MALFNLPLIVEPAELENHLDANDLLIVDLSRPEIYAQGHIPGAVHIDFAQIVAAQPPVMGALPTETHLSEVFSSMGMRPESHVLAYDDEGGGRASRLLWTLDVIGHPNASLLNGGLQAWQNERRPISRDSVIQPRRQYTVTFQNQAIADKNYITRRLHDPHVAIVDARTPGEYRGEIKRALRNGHIPGALNFDWMNAVDKARDLRLKPAVELKHRLFQLGVTPDKEVIAYCQTHHRSAHTYIVLKSLGYLGIKGYPGSWSEWGNSLDTPIE
ncbi:MAG: sulfurtransferase [Sulfuricaulis sp.]